MYVQAIWKEQGGNTTIAQLVDVPDWQAAGTKLPYAYPGYDLKNMNLITFTVDPKNIYAPCWLCSYIDNETGSRGSVYIFDETFDGAVEQLKVFYKQTPTSVTKTELTYKSEK